MDLTAPGLENAHIRLVVMTEEYRDVLRNTSAVEHMWNSMPAIQRGAGFDAYFDYMLQCAKTGQAISFVILCARTGHFIGVTAYLFPDKMHRRVLISYTWIDEPFRGKGVYKAVQALLIQRALDWGARRIGWNVEARNTRAINAIESLGAKHEGVLRQYSRFADGTWADIAMLSLLRDEAKAVVKRLNDELEVSEA